MAILEKGALQLVSEPPGEQDSDPYPNDPANSKDNSGAPLFLGSLRTDNFSLQKWKNTSQEISKKMDMTLETLEKILSELKEMRKQKDQERTSRILEVKICNMVYPISIEVLCEVFDPHGYIESITISFIPNGLRALIQFESYHSAFTARDDLHGRYIYEGCCQLDIHFHTYEYNGLVDQTDDSFETFDSDLNEYNTQLGTHLSEFEDDASSECEPDQPLENQENLDTLLVSSTLSYKECNNEETSAVGDRTEDHKPLREPICAHYSRTKNCSKIGETNAKIDLMEGKFPVSCNNTLSYQVGAHDEISTVGDETETELSLLLPEQPGEPICANDEKLSDFCLAKEGSAGSQTSVTFKLQETENKGMSMEATVDKFSLIAGDHISLTSSPNDKLLLVQALKRNGNLVDVKFVPKRALGERIKHALTVNEMDNRCSIVYFGKFPAGMKNAEASERKIFIFDPGITAMNYAKMMKVLKKNWLNLEDKVVFEGVGKCYAPVHVTVNTKFAVFVLNCAREPENYVNGWCGNGSKGGFQGGYVLMSGCPDFGLIP